MAKNSVQEQTKHQRSFSSLIVMTCTLATRILGFLKFVVISAIFGGQGGADILNAVLSIPNNLRKLMAEGALSTAFIPSLSGKLVQKDQLGAQRLARHIMGLQWLILLPLVIFIMIFHKEAIHIFVHFDSEEEMRLAGNLLYWVAPYILIVSLSAVLMAVLNSHNHFFVAAICPLLFSLAIICTTLMFHRSMGIFSMALGVLIGGAAQLLLQYPGYRRLGYRLMPSFHLNDPDVLSVLKQWGPILATSSIFAINQQVAVFLASDLETGSSTALANAVVFFQLPFGIFSASVNTVYYPQISRYVHQGAQEELKESLTSGLRLLMVSLLPAAFILGILGHEIISVAFMRGAFQARHVDMAAQTLRGFCWGMFFTAGCNFIQRFFYAKRRILAPFLSAFISCGLDILLSLVLIRTPLGVAGLAHANSLAFFISFALLFLLMRFKYKNIRIRPLLIESFKVLAVLFATYGIYIFLRQFWGSTWWMQGGSWKNFARLCYYGFVLCLTILLGYGLLGIKILDIICRKR